MSRPTRWVHAILTVACGGALSACSFAARDADTYRSATRALLESQRATLQSCYEGVQAADPGARGDVVVDFNVDAETGTLSEPTIIPGTTTAPQSLQQCVIGALDGLALEPPDQRRGDALFTWSFVTEASPES